MKTSIKKLLCLLMALVCIFAFAACTADNEEADEKEASAEAETDENTDEPEEPAEPEEEPTEEELAEEVVSKFLDAICAFDFEEASKYLVDETMLEGTEGVFSAEAIVAAYASDEEMAPYLPYLEDVATALFDKYKDTMEYEITSVVKDGDAYICSITTIGADLDILDSSYIETLLAEAFTDEELEEIAMTLYEEGKITDESTEEEMTTVLMDVMFEKIVEMIENLELETESDEGELVVVKEGKDWLIEVN